VSVSIGAMRDEFLREYAPSSPVMIIDMAVSLDALIEAVIQFTLDSLREIADQQIDRGRLG